MSGSRGALFRGRKTATLKALFFCYFSFLLWKKKSKSKKILYYLTIPISFADKKIAKKKIARHF
jgi:hypothetical protein